MNDREKLIELIKQKERCLCDMCVPGNERERNAIKLADHLIAHGVTVGGAKSATATLSKEDKRGPAE